MRSPPVLELRPHKTLWSGDMVWARVCAGLPGGGVHHTRAEVSMTDKRSSTEKQVRQIVSVLCCFLQVALCLCWGVEEGNGGQPAPLFQRGIAVSSVSQGHAPRRANNVPVVCPRHSSDHYFHAVCPWIVCLPSLQEQHITLWAPSEACWPLKLQTLCPTGSKNSWSSAPLIFQANGYGENVLLVYSPVCFSFSCPSLWPHLPLLLSTCNLICLFPKPGLYASYFLQCDSSLPLAVEFVLSVFGSISGVFRMIWWLSSGVHGMRQA